MYKKILIIIYFTIIIFFLTSVSVVYFSKDNKDKIKNNRFNYYNSIEKKNFGFTFFRKWYEQHYSVQLWKFRRKKNKKKIFLEFVKKQWIEKQP